MSWLSRVRSGIPFLPKRQSSENLWHKCKKCGTMVFVKEWEDNLNVCPRCDYHDRIGWSTRYEQLFDKGEYEPLLTAGPKADCICGFARIQENRAVLVIAARFPFRREQDPEWQGTTIAIPPRLASGRFRSIFTGKRFSQNNSP